MQWIRRCYLHTALLIAICGEAQPDVHQKARNQASSVESSTVFRRVDGLTIPWRRQTPNNRYCRQSPANWVYVGLANVRCENWAYGSTSKPTRSILSLPATRPEPSWTLSLKPQTCINICRFSGKLPDTELSKMHDMLRNLICAREHEKKCCTLQSDGVHGPEGSPDISPGSLSELYAEFLERHAQHTCRVSERRMRCIQLRQALRDAESVEAYPHIIYSQLWDKEEGAWSRFLHERDLDALRLPR